MLDRCAHAHLPRTPCRPPHTGHAHLHATPHLCTCLPYVQTHHLPAHMCTSWPLRHHRRQLCALPTLPCPALLATRVVVVIGGVGVLVAGRQPPARCGLGARLARGSWGSGSPSRCGRWSRGSSMRSKVRGAGACAWCGCSCYLCPAAAAAGAGAGATPAACRSGARHVGARVRAGQATRPTSGHAPDVLRALHGSMTAWCCISVRLHAGLFAGRPRNLHPARHAPA